MTMFDDAMKEAEQALKKHRAPPAKQVNGTKAATPVDVHGVRLATLEDLRELRDDVNTVLDNIEQTPAKPRVLQVVQNDTLIGEMEGLRHENFEVLVRACMVTDKKGMRKNIALSGPTGGGKSTALVQVAELLKLDYHYMGQTELPTDVMGYVHPITKDYVDTPFVRAFINGGMYVAEEMDAWSPRATLVLNVPLANGYITLPDGTTHERHKDFIMVACMNTWGSGATADYVGRNKLDAAYLNRFGVRMKWDYDPDLERKAAGNDEVVDVVQNARWNARKENIKVIVSPRTSIDMADMVACGFTLFEAANMTFLQGLDKSQRKRLLDGSEL